MRMILHTFNMGDVEDVDIYVAQPIYEWQQTEKGAWCMSNATDLTYDVTVNPNNFGYKIIIKGEVEQSQAVECILRWGYVE